ncbi:MAG: Fe-S cluster assembly protein SufB [Candidatus Doudnabacteria bacterium]|nr:Fe-S cluster assembly protein SufB [Candidatus Doudnabacteria bacterium]
MSRPTSKQRTAFNGALQIERGTYDAADNHTSKFVAPEGLTEELVREISAQKSEPDWMLEKRLQGLAFFQNGKLPSWGPDLSDLNLDEITYFVRPDAEESTDWEDVPPEIRETFDKLGIPEAEKEMLAGAGAQYDSDVVYHNLKQEWKEKGVIFENMDVAVQKYPELVQKYFLTCIPPNDHLFASLHAAVWSGGTFIYVPKGVTVDIPMQAYFRMNTQGGGQFEHTLIIADEGSELQYIEGCSAPKFAKNALHAGGVEIFVHEGARVKYSSVENWSKNTYNLNTKRALVDKNATMEWVNGNMGSGVTMLYPSSVLRGEHAVSHSLGVAFAGAGQNQDTGAKAIHAAPNTKSTIVSKSISRDGGISSYRGLVRMTPAATGSTSTVQCDALLIDAESTSNTYPYMKIDADNTELTHEATVGRIGEAEIFYLMSRGLSEDDAKRLVVAGFIEPIVKTLPLEYAVELNKLIELEMEGSIG